MSSKKVPAVGDGANYAPSSAAAGAKVVAPGEFNFAVAYLDHGHINGQTNGLLDAGATLTKVYDPDNEKAAQFCQRYPHAKVAQSFDDLLQDRSVHLIVSAAIPDQRASIGMQVMLAGKDYFTDKSPFTTLAQLDEVKRVNQQTGQRYFVYYAERVHNEAAWHAGELIRQGVIGDVIQVMSIAPHRLAAANRPAWFFAKTRYGGIITDIGSHQVEQFLTYAECSDATVNFAAVRNQNHKQYPELEDFGEFSLTGDNGASFYSRVDWFTPEALPVWGDGRTFVLGTRGTLEVRKYIDMGNAPPTSSIWLVNDTDMQEINCQNKVGFPFFGQMILDVLHGTQTSMTQAHIFKAAQISMQAQELADIEME